ncbi:MAG: hypothetical protein FWC41_05100 [Firmicutes bacterium]|nr:hypothetical protein [Bacillota bacterium]
MAKFKFSENNPLTDTKKIKNYNPDAVITKQPPIFLDEKNAKGESFNTWLIRMNTEIYNKYAVSITATLGSNSKDNFNKLEMKNMYYKNMESPEVFRLIKEHLFGSKEQNNEKNSFST